MRQAAFFMGDPVKEYLPHGVTENEFLERLDPENLENIQKGIAYTMIRRKTFEDARVLKKTEACLRQNYILEITLYAA